MIGKDSTLEEKIKYLRENILDVSTKDTLAIRNIYCLISSQSLNDAFFNNKDILFKDLEEFSDIKIELKTDLDELKKIIAYYYLATIASCRSAYFIKKEDSKEVPNLIVVLMFNLGFFSLNNILFKNVGSVDTKNLPFIVSSTAIMIDLLSPLFTMNSVMTSILESK